VTFDRAVRTLEPALRQPLPGAEAHAFMAPLPPREWPTGFKMADLRHAAGLLLVFPRDAQAHVILTVRADTLGRHKGQISLPGGAIEPGETFEQAALREAHEEIGLSLADLRTLGALSPIDIVVSGFRLHPIVSAVPHLPELQPAAGEVARILEIPVERLMDGASQTTRSLQLGGRVVTAPTFLVEGAEIWGATAMVLAEFLVILGWQQPGR
jgi:8-oxo-dGTP pyrophosphatase MutT (NUDIX family)